MSTTGLLVDPALIQWTWKWPSEGLRKTLWHGRWSYDMVWWDHFCCFMEKAAIICTPESWGVKGPWKGLTQESPQVSPGSVSFLWHSPWSNYWLACGTPDVYVPAWKIQPIWFPPHAAWQCPVTRSRRSTHNLSSWHTSLHHVGGLLGQNHDVFIPSVTLLCLCDKCRLCWRWDVFSNFEQKE